MADAASVLSSLPAPLQLALSLGTGLAALGAAIYRIAKPANKPADDKPAPIADEAKTLALAMVAPMVDANQLRQVVELLNRVSDFLEHILRVVEGMQTGQDRAAVASDRVEKALDRVERAVRGVDDTITRQPRH